MDKIVKEFEFKGDMEFSVMENSKPKGKVKVKALMDTVVSVSLIRKDIAEKNIIQIL